MKPLMVLVRDHIAPLLLELGFRGRGMRYRYESDDGRQIYLHVDDERRTWGEADVRFLVSVFVMTREELEFRHEAFGAEAPDAYPGPRHFIEAVTNFTVRDPQAGFGNWDVWEFDVDDKASLTRLLEEIRRLLERLVDALPPDLWEALLRDESSWLAKSLWPPVKRLQALFVLMVHQERWDEADALLHASEASLHNRDEESAWMAARRQRAAGSVKG